MRVCFVAAPLMARSGVFMTVLELIESGRAQGFDWSAVIGLRPEVFHASTDRFDHVRLVEIVEHGNDCIKEIDRKILRSNQVDQADVVITLISQSDIAMSRSGLRRSRLWVPFVRGLPWPAPGEANALIRVAKTLVERRALRSAPEFWATTRVLADQIRSAGDAVIVPAGVKRLERNTTGTEVPRFIWAGRFDVDKDPLLFLHAMRETSARGVIYGRGPLESQVLEALPSNVEFGGWAPASQIWAEPGIFVGTSLREAFGRSAVEAASTGKPVVLDASYGCADLLYRSAELYGRLVLTRRDVDLWAEVVQELVTDDDLRVSASEHVRESAESLTIDKSAARVHSELTRLTA